MRGRGERSMFLFFQKKNHFPTVEYWIHCEIIANNMCVWNITRVYMCICVQTFLYFTCFYTWNAERTEEHIRIVRICANMRRVSLQYDSYFSTRREATYRHCFQFSKLLWCFCSRLLAKYCLHAASIQSTFNLICGVCIPLLYKKKINCNRTNCDFSREKFSLLKKSN